MYLNLKVFYIVTLIIILLLNVSCRNELDRERRSKLRRVVGLLSDRNFTYANIDSNMLVFRNKKLKIIGKEKIPELIFRGIKSEKILLIRKIRMGFMFTLTRVVDDEQGLIYSKSNLVDFNGLNWVERLDGSWFYFSTIRK